MRNTYKSLWTALCMLLIAQWCEAQVSVKLGGRLFVDGLTYINAPDTFSHAAGIPDVRLRAVVSLPKGWKTKIDVKFANNKVKLSDAFLQKIHQQHVFRAGYMFGFFGLDQSYSTNDYPFLTGSNIAETFYPGRRTGVSYNYAGKKYYFATGFFVGDKLTADNRKQGFNTSARFVYRPVAKDNHIFHLGTSFYYRVPDQDKLTKKRGILFSNTANTYLSEPAIFETYLKDVDAQYQCGVEVLNQSEHCFLQSEFMMTAVKSNDRPTYHAHGCYVEGGWLLSGKMLKYDYIDALPYCTSEPHSFLLFARYNYTNLNDTEIKAGRLHDVTIGANYYLNKYLLFKVNYSHQWTDSHTRIGKANWGMLQGRIDRKSVV